MAKKETKKARNERVTRILELLDREYGTEYRCYLDHETPWQLLIAVILSAQCTDARVNIVTKDLFKKYDSLEKFANADLKEMEKDIHSTGFYHNKAKNIIACCRQLLERHGGEVPGSIEELTELAGVGRKTANVIRGNIFHEPSIVVDTHVKRISKKLGLTKEECDEKFGFLLEAFKYGAPPHGGIGLGLDRLVMQMLRLETLRDCIAFPKVQNASEPMTECPALVDNDQLEMLGIGVVFFLIIRSSSNGNNKAFEFGKNRAKLQREKTKSFADVAGCDEEKEELQSVLSDDSYEMITTRTDYKIKWFFAFDGRNLFGGER